MMMMMMTSVCDFIQISGLKGGRASLSLQTDTLSSFHQITFRKQHRNTWRRKTAEILWNITEGLMSNTLRHSTDIIHLTPHFIHFYCNFQQIAKTLFKPQQHPMTSDQNFNNQSAFSPEPVTGQTGVHQTDHKPADTMEETFRWSSGCQFIILRKFLSIMTDWASIETDE